MVGADLDLDRVIQESNSTNRHTILFLHKDGCRFCERMIFDLEESNISETIDRDFLFIDINRDDDERQYHLRDMRGERGSFSIKLELSYIQQQSL